MVTRSGVAPTHPLRLEANTVPSFYAGEGRIGRWRGAKLDPTHPEDWIASTSRRTGMGDRGLSVLPNGVLLADAVKADPVGWLGERGERAGLLLKLLDAGERLPVHVHPDGNFARAHLAQPNGKAEAWLVLHAEAGSAVHIGFADDVPADRLAAWVAAQDISSLLAAMNRVEVMPGDVIYCPPRVPHSIGDGVLIIEIQEPSDSSIMLEWDGFPIAEADRFLGLDPSTALSVVDRSGYRTRMTALLGRSFGHLVAPGEHPLLPADATSYFAADLLIATREVPVRIDQGFAVLFIVAGGGMLKTEDQPCQVRRGEAWLIPAVAGDSTLKGDVRAIRCRAA